MSSIKARLVAGKNQNRNMTSCFSQVIPQKDF